MAAGGIDSLDVVAQLATLGLDPQRFLHSDSLFEQYMLLELAKRVQKYRDIEQTNLAVKVATEVSKLFKK